MEVLPWSTWAIIAILRSFSIADWSVTWELLLGVAPGQGKGMAEKGAHYTHLGVAGI